MELPTSSRRSCSRTSANRSRCMRRRASRRSTSYSTSSFQASNSPESRLAAWVGGLDEWGVPPSFSACDAFAETAVGGSTAARCACGVRRCVVRGEWAATLILAAVVAADRTALASSYTIVPGGPPVTVTTTAVDENGTATFSGTAGRSISLKISSVTISSALVSILKPDGTALVAASSFGTAGKFIDRTTLPVTGTYTILVDPQGTAIGGATLTLYDVPADVTGSITPGGAAVTVTTTTPGQNAKVTFSGTAGRRISLKVGPTCCSLKVSILKPDGTALVAATAIGTAGGFIDVKSLTVTGTYTIVVAPQSSAVGATTLPLYDVPADVTGSITPGGAAVTVTTTTPGQNAKVTFSGTAGRRISLKVGPTCCSLKVSILKPDGTALVAATAIGTAGGVLAGQRPTG